MSDTSKTIRSFQCRDSLWERFEQMARELECSVDYLVNDAMKQYARQRGYGGGSVALPTGRSMQPGGSAPNASAPMAPPVPAPPAVAPPPPPAVGYAGYSAAPPIPAFGGAPPPPPPPAYLSQGAPGAVSHGAMITQAPPTVHRSFAPQAPPAPPMINYGGAPAAPPPPPGYVAPPPPPGYAAPGGRAPAPAPVRSPVPPRRGIYVYYGGERFVVNKDRFIIGRGKQSSDLTIKDPNVSRQHAVVEYSDGRYYMVDMGSTNGVEFGGRRVQRQPINEGDTFRVCDHELRFSYS